MNQEIIVVYTPKFSKTILWVFWFHSIGRIYLLASIIAFLILAPIMILAKINFIVLLLAIISGFLYILKRSAPQVENSIPTSYQVQKFTFSESHLELEVGQQQSHYLWDTIKAIHKYPTLWLIAFSGMPGYFALPTKNLDEI